MSDDWRTVVEFVGGPLCGERRTFVLPLGGDYRELVNPRLFSSEPVPTPYDGARHIYKLKPWRGRTIYFYEGIRA